MKKKPTMAEISARIKANNKKKPTEKEIKELYEILDKEGLLESDKTGNKQEKVAKPRDPDLSL